MRRILVAAALAAAACGSKPTIMATPAIKATASQAQLGMSSTSTNTQASIGLQSIGSSIGDAVNTGSVSTVDLSTGLRDPNQIAAAAMTPGAGGVQQALRLGGSSTAATIPAGCVIRITGTPTLVAAGTQGCSPDATTYLEVDYDTGDKVKVTWSDNTTSFDLKIEVIAGPWTGTNLHYSGHVTGSSSASVSVSGVMLFSRSGSTVQVNADFNITYAVSVSLGSNNSTTVNINVNGTATDHIALVHAYENWGLSMQDSTNGTTSTAVIHWNGGIRVDVLKQDGVTTDHSVVFNLNVNVTSTTTGTTVSTTWSAGGDLEYDGAVAGHIVTKNNQLYVDWTDGMEDAFDPSALLGPTGV